MTKFETGSLYIVKAKNAYWYQIVQTGDKSWEAVMFGSLDVSRNNIYRHGNGKGLYENLAPTEVYAFYNLMKDIVKYRKTMFNICKYGKAKGEEDGS